MTVLFVGGAYQGKRALAKDIFGLVDADFACGKACTAEQLRAAKGLDGLHHYVRRLLDAGAVPDNLLQDLCGKVVLCSDIGCGIVPTEQTENTWREATGRLCCSLATQAELVVRVTAGIGCAIKGSLPASKERG